MKKIIIASGPVIEENGKVLLNKHGDTTFWKFCGGQVENFSENLIETARLEARQEMGIEIEILSEVPFIAFTRKEHVGELIDIVLVHFLAKRVGEINPRADIREWDWLEIKSLDPKDLAPNIIPTLEHFKLF